MLRQSPGWAATPGAGVWREVEPSSDGRRHLYKVG